MPSEAHEIITRKEAKAAGLTRYFTGKPCKRIGATHGQRPQTTP
jgi:hypothetical protein